jgi:hypothetical protein
LPEATLTYEEEKKLALATWADHVLEAVREERKHRAKAVRAGWRLNTRKREIPTRQSSHHRARLTVANRLSNCAPCSKLPKGLA